MQALFVVSARALLYKSVTDACLRYLAVLGTHLLRVLLLSRTSVWAGAGAGSAAKALMHKALGATPSTV